MAAPEQMKIGLSMRGHGYHQSAWHHPEADPFGPLQLRYFIELTQIAERGLFDMTFLADYSLFPMRDTPKGALGRRAVGGFEPLTLLSAIAPATAHIGLAATASTTYMTPFHVARSFGSLDQISGGRAAWNVVTSYQSDEAANFGSDALPEKALRYERAEEFVDVVTGLWDSFDADAFQADTGSGLYFDPAKVRPLSHQGTHFQVAGPLPVPRSPQGRPVLIQAGASEPGQELAARTADVVYAAQSDLESGQAYYASLKARVAKHGRDPSHLKILPGIMPVIGDTMAEAEARYEMMKELLDPMIGLEYLATILGDLSAYPLDGPVPDPEPGRELYSRGQLALDMARRRGLTIRELYQAMAITYGHNLVVGTPETVADEMERWFSGGAADGFNLLPAISPGDLVAFVDKVVPVLQSRGLFRTAYEGTTLRENLGLPEV